MVSTTSGALGDTSEFLKMAVGQGAAAPEKPAARVEERPIALPDPGTDMPHKAPAASSGPQPLIIKGGPRRVVRADGKMPEVSTPKAQKRFELSSGHAMFTRHKKFPAIAVLVLFILAAVVVAAVFGTMWYLGKESMTQSNRSAVIGTTQYDSWLSKTPANDGGYYTVFLVTSTPTDEEVIGDLARVMMVRADKDVTVASRVDVPVNLYVASGKQASESVGLATTLRDKGITRVLQAVTTSLGARLYNVVCCQQSVYDELAAVMEGRAPQSTLTQEALFGHVRTNLTLADLIAYCGAVGAMDQSGIVSFAVTGTPITVAEGTLVQVTPNSYQTCLMNSLVSEAVGSSTTGAPIMAQLDEYGNYFGTKYDGYGNPILDWTGAPEGSIRDENGDLWFDDNGYLQFFGQMYDRQGNPYGTQYDAQGNPLLDEWGNPAGTQYDEWGNVVLDWRGTMLIVH